MSVPWYAVRLAPGKTAMYRIGVEGCLERSLSWRLNGMNIMQGVRIDGSTVTTLVGQVRNQDELLELLTTLNRLHLPILHVDVLDGE
jgi:hypothetical protein